MSTHLPLLHKNALVTGAAVGIGSGIATKLVELGANVVIHYANRQEEAKAEKLVHKLGRQSQWPNPKIDKVRGDFGKLTAARQVVDQTLTILDGKIDILVNNAGVTLDTALRNVTPELFTFLYNVNVGAMLFLTQQITPSMIKHGGGSIINISSIHAKGGVPGHSVYAGTKGGIEAMTRELAIELARQNIRVNAVSPGGIEVPRQKKMNPQHSPEKFGKFVPLGRIGTVDDIAEAVAFFASDKASWITGQVLGVDGGNSAMMAVDIPHTREMDTPLSRHLYLPRKKLRRKK